MDGRRGAGARSFNRELEGRTECTRLRSKRRPSPGAVPRDGCHRCRRDNSPATDSAVRAAAAAGRAVDGRRSPTGTSRALAERACVFKNDLRRRLGRSLAGAVSARAQAPRAERPRERGRATRQGLTFECDPRPGGGDGQSPKPAMCVRNVDVHVSCSSHVDAHFAAFFIDPRAK